MATIYEAGGIVTSPLDDILNISCAPGIHFFSSEKAALDWGIGSSDTFFLAALCTLNNINYIPPES
jgi:hypothetical protein